ncbi:MAG: hypothetical protein ACT4QB_11870 [Gammaproteobacteria bacterium]
MSDKTTQSVPQAQGPRPAHEDPGAEANVQKIREIIFGGQMREYERRFGELAARLESETKRTRTELEQRLTTFEAFVHKELEQINGQIQKERDERSGLLNKAEQSLAAADRTLTDKLVRLDDQFSREAGEIRKHLHTQITDLVNRIGQLGEQIQTTITQETHRLHADKVGRSDLSELLTEVALRLNDGLGLALQGLPGDSQPVRPAASK